MMDTGYILLFCIFCFELGKCQKKNILFFASDDMRPELGIFYGPDFPSPVHPKIYSPNLDVLAKKSLLLKRAYVQQAVCSPSRTSLLTGRRPDTTHVYDLIHYFRNVGGNYTTIPQFFKNNGYSSIGMGKIFHPGIASDFDDPVSWTEPYYHAPDQRFRSTLFSWRAVPKAEYDIRPLPDMQIAQHAMETLQKVAPAAKSGQQNFFVAVGFHKPHLPFVFPEEYLSLYPLNSIKLPDNQFAPVDMPDVAWSNYITTEMYAYHDIQKLNASGNINTTLPDQVVKDLRRAYYSSVSYTDNMLGKVMAELDRLELTNSTIVSFWGDHGWQLGEHGEWCKHTNFEDAVHAPMMIHVPGMTEQGVVTEKLTEYVDLFPTLVEAAGFEPLDLCPEDSTHTSLCREGNSLVPLITNPSREWKQAVFSQYPRNNYTVMGYTIRTDLYRYTEWVEFLGPPAYKPNWSTLFGVELYDHSIDSEENVNRADHSQYRDIRSKLSYQLRRGWRYSQPLFSI